MRRLFITSLFVFCQMFVYAQALNFNWSKGAGGFDFDYLMDVAIDHSHNVYQLGLFQQTVDFDPGSGAYPLSSNGGHDIFISKLDSAGNFLWAKQIGNNNDESVSGMSLDSSGNVYIIGSFKETVDFDPGVNTFNVTSAPAVGGTTDLFILKLDSSGNFSWVKTFGGWLDDNGNSITISANGEILITGTFQDVVDFDPGPATYSLTSNGFEDIFILKLNVNGDFIWVKQIGNADWQSAGLIVGDSSNNIYIVGGGDNTIDVNPGSGVFNISPPFPPGSVSFIVKLNTNGSFVWAKQFEQEALRDIQIDDDGNLYILGGFLGTLDFNFGPAVYNLTSAGDYDMFFMKLDSNGNFNWAKRIGSTGTDQMNSLIFDGNNNLFLTGNYSNVVDFDPGTGVSMMGTFGTIGYTDAFLARYDTAGSFEWSTHWGSISSDGCYLLRKDNSNNIFAAGMYSGSFVDFDPGPNNYYLPSYGSFDMYVSKFNYCQYSSATLTLNSCHSYTLNGVTYTNTGTYAQQLTNVAGCDSTVHLNLTIYNNTYNTVNVAGCNTYSLNGQTYTVGGTYTQTLINSNGCDSILTINLTIGTMPSSSTVTATACDSSTLNGQTYSSSGTYFQLLTNASGCDSNLTYILTIHSSNGTSITDTSCHSFTVNSQTYTTSGIYTQLFTNAIGCDSILTLNVTINAPNNSVTQSGIMLTSNATGATYQWVICPAYTLIAGATNQNYTATSNGDYAVIVTQNSCIDTSLCYMVTGVGVNEYLSFSGISISPNPTPGELNVTSRRPLRNASIKISHVSGQTILQKEKLNGMNFKFDISKEAVGIYFVEIKEAGKMERIKVELR